MTTSRKAVARELKIDSGLLRQWERCGLMPTFGTIPAALYRDRVRLILAARRVLSTQRVREALATGGC